MAGQAYRLGPTSKAYYASGGSWGTETWGEIGRFADVTVNPGWGEIVGTDRLSGVESVVKGLPKVEVDGRIRVDETDAGYQAVVTALDSRAAVNMLFLNGPKDSEGAEGFKGFFHVLGGQIVQGLENMLFRELRFKPAVVPSTTPFKKAVVASGGASITYSDYLPPP